MRVGQNIARVFVTAIVILTLIPMLGLFLGGATDKSVAQEKRNLTPWPEFSQLIEAPEIYASKISGYLSDRFGGRQFAIKYYNKIKRKIDAGNQQVLVGRDGWYFLNYAQSWSNFSGRASLSTQDQEKWNQVISGFRFQSEQAGAVFLATYAPDKNQIYPEYAPEKFGKLSRTRQVNDLDWDFTLDQVLQDGKAEALMFFKTDTHWTHTAGFLAYQEIMGQFARRGLSLPVLKEKQLETREMKNFQGDLIALMGSSADGISENLTNRFAPEPKPEPILSKVDSPSGDQRFQTRIYDRGSESGPTLVIIGDSFSNALIPYFNTSFGKVVFVHNEVGNFDFQYALDFKPDAILFMPVERYASILLSYK